VWQFMQNVVRIKLRNNTRMMMSLRSTLLLLFYLQTKIKHTIGVKITRETEPKQSKSRVDSNKYISIKPAMEYFEIEFPDCAKDVLVQLHNEKVKTCKGILIRDDLIITTESCSILNFTFTFKFDGLHKVHARPNIEFNAKFEETGAQFGFLKVDIPFHNYFIDQSVQRGYHRTRLFLSERFDKKSVMTCGVNQEPILHSFPIDFGDSIPLVKLKNNLPENILWQESDLNTAVMLQHNTVRWWVKPITLEHEMAEISEIIDLYVGPPGSLSVPTAHHHFNTKVIGMLEVVDPRGHRRTCLKEYYSEWQQNSPFSQLHFFDWLDYGPAKFSLDSIPPGKSDCGNKTLFNSKTVKYFDDELRLLHEIYFKASNDKKQTISKYNHNDEFVPKTEENESHLYMWGLDGKFYIVDDTWDQEMYGRIKHTSVFAGKPVLSAGRAHFAENGTLLGINFASGHYRPDINSAAIMYSWMENQGLNISSFHWIGRSSWDTDSCLEVVWEDIDISGICEPPDCGSVLKLACHDVTKSPTWILRGDY